MSQRRQARQSGHRTRVAIRHTLGLCILAAYLLVSSGPSIQWGWQLLVHLLEAPHATVLVHHAPVRGTAMPEAHHADLRPSVPHEHDGVVHTHAQMDTSEESPTEAPVRLMLALSKHYLIAGTALVPPPSWRRAYAVPVGPPRCPASAIEAPPPRRS